MAQNQAPVNSGQGNQNRKPNANPQSNKVDIRVTPDIRQDIKNKICNITIRIKLVKHQQVLIGQEVVLEERLSIIDSATTDNDGVVVFQFKENMKDVEQVKILIVSLTGLVDDKNFSLTIPALLPTPKPIDKTIVINVISIPNPKHNTCAMTFEGTVLENGKGVKNQMVICKRGLGSIGTQKTTSSGQVIFNDNLALTDIEQVIIYRFELSSSSEFELVTVTLPAGIPKPELNKNLAEKMGIRSYYGNNGEFSVKVRVLQAHAVGLRTPISAWFRGRIIGDKTDNNGEFVYSLPGNLSLTITNPVLPGLPAPNTGNLINGQAEKFSVAVSGIKDEAKLNLNYIVPEVCPYHKNSLDWFLLTNNGRTALLAYLFCFFLTLSLMFGIGNVLIGPMTFRGDDGLSQQERMNNEVVGKIMSSQKFEPKVSQSSKIYTAFCGILWKTTIIIFALLVISALISLWKSVRGVIVENFDRIFDGSEARVGDPLIERWASDLGLFHIARKSPEISVHTDPQGANANSNPNSNPGAAQTIQTMANNGHPSLGQMFQMDVLSDALVQILAGAFKKIF